MGSGLRRSVTGLVLRSFLYVELELIHPQMSKKRILRGEVGALVWQGMKVKTTQRGPFAECWLVHHLEGEADGPFSTHREKSMG